MENGIISGSRCGKQYSAPWMPHELLNYVGQGVGVAAYLGGELELSNFVLEGPALCGAQLAFDAEMDLHHGEVRKNLIGVCVQIPGYDLWRLTEGVAYAYNDINMQTADLPIPVLPPVD